MITIQYWRLELSNSQGVAVRISELARESGVPVATVKYYLREGLLREGRRTAATQAQYDDEHVSRLRLIRALLGPGKLSVATAREVLAHIDAPPAATHDLLGLAQATVTPPAAEGVDLRRVHELMRRWGWQVDPQACDSQAVLAEALTGLEAAGLPVTEHLLDRYAAAMFSAAEAEIDGVPTDSVDEAVRYVVLGTVLVEPVLLALRRLAEQEASKRRFAGRPTP